MSLDEMYHIESELMWEIIKDIPTEILIQAL